MSLRIAVIAHSHHPIAEPYAGGLEMHTHLLCRTLASMGIEVTLFAKAGSVCDGYQVEPTLPEDFTFYPHPKYSPAWSVQEFAIHAAYSKTLDRIEAGTFDAVINNTFNAAALEWSSDTPMLSVLHTPVLPLLERPAKRAAQNPLRSFVAVSAANADAWRSVISNLHVVTNGIETKRWCSNAAAGDDLRWCARVTPEKGLEKAIKGARITGRKLLIAGPISDSSYFGHCIEPLLGSDVEYVGHLDHADLADFYASGAATLVTPEWEEPFGLVVAESLASGTPVAAFARGAMVELVTQDVGALSEYATPESLAQAIELAVTKDRALCKASALKRFDCRLMVEQYLKLLADKRLTGKEMATACAG